MKENTETICNSIFTHCHPGHFRENQLFQFYACLKRRLHSLKDQMHNGAAVLGIGSVFLATTYFFFLQLAEYGWQ